MKKKILVVDNHPVVLEFITGLLKREEHDVVAAEDGISALRTLKSFTPDIMFVDLIMPRINGEKLCQIVRNMDHLNGCFFVIISAAIAEQGIDYLRIGADAYLPKGSFQKMGEHILAMANDPDPFETVAKQNPTVGLGEVYARQMTKELLCQNRHLEIILEDMSEGILEVCSEMVTYANSAALCLLGFDQKRLLGSYLPDLFDPFTKQRVEALLRSTKNKPSEIGIDRPVKINGSLLAMKNLPLKEEPSTTIILISDVSSQKRVEETLRKQRRDLRERVKELNCLYRISHLVEKPEISLEEIIQGTIDLIPPYWQYPELTCARATLEAQIFTTGNFRETNWKLSSDITLHGKKIGTLEVFNMGDTSEIEDEPFHKEEKNLLNAISERLGGIIERKRIEEEKSKLQERLQQAQKMEAVGTLAGGVAHDFNNLMMGILGNVSLMLYGINYSHPHYEKLKNIEDAIQRSTKLTSQLLGYARKGKYEVKPINLNQIAEESSETFGRTRKEITIHKEFAEDLFALEADENQIQQVLLNLYINAADAMPGGGDLYLKTLNVTHKEMEDKPYNPKPGSYVFLKVTDNGIGMDNQIIERIFDPFFTTKKMGQGTGLGLAAVYGIIKGHGGFVDVESKKGRGTAFSIYLPASDKKIPKTVKTPDQAVKGSETILFVDDEEMVSNISSQILKRFGYTVLEAKSGRDAIEIYRGAHNIDLVILDMIMPEMGGGETYDRLKGINPDIKVLLSSGYSIDGQAEEILGRGCDGFIQKPFSIKELSQKLREILDND